MLPIWKYMYLLFYKENIRYAKVLMLCSIPAVYIFTWHLHLMGKWWSTQQWNIDDIIFQMELDVLQHPSIQPPVSLLSYQQNCKQMMSWQWNCGCIKKQITETAITKLLLYLKLLTGIWTRAFRKANTWLSMKQMLKVCMI